MHENENIDYVASAARTTAQSFPEQSNRWHVGAHFVINVTAVTATPVLTPRIQGQDPVTAGWYDVLVGTDITATGMTVLKVGPGIAGVSGASANDFLPSIWRVKVDVTDTDSATYSIGVHLLG